MKFLFETMRFLLKYITLNQQITPTETFHTYFTTFQTAASNRITSRKSTIGLTSADCAFPFSYLPDQIGKD